MVRYILTTALNLIVAASLSAAPTSKVITGTVVDDTRQPLVGATVVLFADGASVSGTASDQNGRFRFTIKDTYQALTMRVSSVGYFDTERVLKLDDSVTVVRIECAPKTVEISSITVRPERDLQLNRLSIPSSQIAKLSTHSLVMSNPIAALQYPQMAKVGSTHSSQIRINGTSPNYYLNGISIGSDPNHYGMFSVIPGSIVDQIDFQPQGTDASYELPSIINMKSVSSFGQESRHDLNFSTLEATGSIQKSTQHAYVVGAVRKSILDALVNSLDINSERQTIPPTSFSDLYLSTGVKLSSRYQVGLDQYHAYDYLAYNTGASTGQHSSVQTYQRARENYFGMRAQAMYSNLLLNATLAVRDGKRSYLAIPGVEEKSAGVHIDLNENQRTYLGSISAATEAAGFELKVGNQTEYVAERTTNLAQENWNFLPPFTTSDNPYIYQNALNKLYGTYHGTMSQVTSAAYLSASRSFGALSVTGGIRSAYYKHLSSNAPLLVRLTSTLRTGQRSNATLFYGTFSEDPLTAVLEPYQVLIREYAAQLRPVSTRLLAANFVYGAAKFEIFHKQITDMPIISPDFEHPFDGTTLDRNFLQMNSEGYAQFFGGSMSMDIKKLFTSRLSFYGSYAFSYGTKTEHDVTYLYESNSPHRVTAQLDYKVSSKITLGSDMQVRSGYHYSPTRPLLAYTERSAYNPDYYRFMLSRENSQQFSPNMAVNFFMSFDFGNSSLHLAVTNVTNRYNPIIKSPSGFVYDAGILPSLGFRWKF